MSVYVLDKHQHPLMPCSEKRAKLLLTRGRAVIHLMLPFTIRLKDRVVSDCECQPIQLKIDPGSKITGLALVRLSESVNVETGEMEQTAHCLSLMELTHRGRQISETLTARRGHRRFRRSKLRYRPARFLNRGNKSKGWLAPSLQHRVNSVINWVKKLQKLTPLTHVAQELVRFDLQKMDNPEISGIEYQQGTLLGYEVREYLLEKWNRQCAYCDAKNIPLQIEHIHPKSKGGSDQISNLCLACEPCNQAKDNWDVTVFLKQDPQRLAKIQSQQKRHLKDAAAVNATRWALNQALKATGLSVSTGSGGLTKYNRVRLNVPKTHSLDALCVGQVNEVRDWQGKPTLQIKCMGRGCYQRTLLTKYGFPRGYCMKQKLVKGFQTGDLVKAEVTKGKKQGGYVGRVAVRQSGSFNIQTPEGVVQGISWRHCCLIQRADGYCYHQATALS